MRTEEILINFKKHKEKIIEILSDKNWKHFRYYFFITENFKKNNLNEEFKKTFCKFYIMNGPMGLNNKQKKKFFKMLLEKENNLEKVFHNLYSIPGYGNSQKLHLSFGSKLLHTVNNNLPIYDKNISKVLMLSDPIQLGTLKEKIQNRIFIYEGIRQNYKDFLENEEIKQYLKNIRKEIANSASKDHFKWDDSLISNTKLLDSLLWALYFILKDKKFKSEDKLPKLTKSELLLFEQSKKNGVAKKYIKWGKPENIQIAMFLHSLSNEIMLENVYASKKKKEKATKLYLKALAYYPNLINHTKRFRRYLGLSAIKK